MDKSRDRRVPAKRPVRRARPAQDADRTKFDKWLDRMREDRSPVEFLFSVHPRMPSSTHRGTTSTAHVCDVDRYMVLLEFRDGEARWVSKSIITSACIANEVDEEMQEILETK